MSLFKLGLIVNPFAGIGGRVALKGSDGEAIRQQALAMGARPEAVERAAAALACLKAEQSQIQILTVARDMGEHSANKAGLSSEVIMQPASEPCHAEDTRHAVQTLLHAGIDILLFAGGDGTARDVYTALESVNATDQLTVIGIPAGCKIHSGVYAVSPQHAGELLLELLQGKAAQLVEADVMDIDEEAFRQGQVKARRYGSLWIPQHRIHMQNLKEGGRQQEEQVLLDIADEVIEQMQSDTLYFIGSGSTPAAIMERLGLENTLLGVDVILNQELIARDVTEQQILDLLDAHDGKIVVTVIGGQGHVFGRGNQQFSPAVLNKIGTENIMIIATPVKINNLNGAPLRVDTGDAELDKKLSGMVRIICGYNDVLLYQIVS